VIRKAWNRWTTNTKKGNMSHLGGMTDANIGHMNKLKAKV